MKKIKVSNVLAVIAICIGVFWIYGMLIQPVFHFLTKPSDISSDLPFLIISLLMSSLGFFSLSFGISLFKEKNKRNIKGTVGTLAVFGVFSAEAVTRINLTQQLPTHFLAVILPHFIATWLIIPVYIFVSKFLMNQEGLTPDSRGEFVGQGILFIIAFQMWMVGNALFEAYAPVEQGYIHLKKEPWNLIGFLAPILAAILFYKLAIHFLKIKTPTRRKFTF